MTKTKHGNIMHLPIFQTFLDAFQFWGNMVQIVLCMVRAFRERNWMLHLAYVRKMLPWCFAYDAINYARYMLACYSNMTNLLEE